MRSFVDVTSTCAIDRTWVAWAVSRINADANRSADTHLVHIGLPVPGVDLYLKDESTHPTGSLKHRLARSLFLYGLCNAAIGPRTTVVEASSGSTAVSEAYFARMVGVPFIAVMPRTTSESKIALIEKEGGRCHFVEDAAAVYDEARHLADECDGYYIDQFTYAERATDWRGNNNIAEAIFDQMSQEPHPVPTWIVVGAGTGGTSATIGRYVRYRGCESRVAVVDPEGSALLAGFRGHTGARDRGSQIEGIGRPRVEPSFVPAVVDRMFRVPDAASVAAMRFIRDRSGLPVGPSTGTNLYGALRLACEMRENGQSGSIVTLVCDSAERYASTYEDDTWITERGWDVGAYRETLDAAWHGEWTDPPVRRT